MSGASSACTSAERDLQEVARHCVWWQEPAEALRRPGHFLACVMTFGDWEDADVARRFFATDRWVEALCYAPPGIFDPASWHYWHRVLGVEPVPPLPRRVLPGAEPAASRSKFTWHLQGADRRDVP